VTRHWSGLSEAAERTETRILLLQTLGHRGDATAAPALVALARTAPPRAASRRSKAWSRLRNPSSLPVLVALVKDPEPDGGGSGVDRIGRLARPGRRRRGRGVVGRVRHPNPHRRHRSGGQRRITSAIPALLKAAGDADAGVAGAGFKALGELAGLAEIPGVVNALLVTQAVRPGRERLARDL
jgi:hypothetical protein